MKNLCETGVCFDCEKGEKREIERRSWGLPIRYKNMTLKNFKQGTQNQKKLYNAAMEFFDNDKGLFISGGAGQGKTHIAVGILQELQGKGIYSKFECVPELFLKLRSGFRSREFDENEFITQYTNQQFLFLDDLGAEKASDYTLQTLYLIFDRRYRSGFSKNIITSNLSLQQLAEYTSDRICSRIAEMCRVVEVQGDDMRLKK